MRKMMTERKHPDGRPYALTIAHRGASAYRYENTLSAIDLAIEMGMDMVEIDIHATSDGRLIVFHDYRLGNRAVEDYSYEEIRRIRLPDGSSIPLLEEVIERVHRRCSLYIEIKSPSSATSVARTIRRYGLTADDVLIGSFHHETVKEAKTQLPEIPAAVLFRCSPVDPIGLAQDARADFVHFCWENMAPHPSRLITPDLVELIRNEGLGIILWHEEREDELSFLQQRCFDGICSDDPLLLKKYFCPIKESEQPVEVRWNGHRRVES